MLNKKNVEASPERRKEMKKGLCIVLTMLLLTFSLTGCGKYASHYSAVAHAYSNDTGSAWTSFYRFEGTEVFKLTIESGKTAKIQYSGELETGSLTVYYDCGKAKTQLFTLHSGDEINACSKELAAGTVYVIIETSDPCTNGSLSFEVIYG